MNRRILFLYELSKHLKSRGDHIRLSSSEFGSFLGISQQTASRYMKELEDEDLIKRNMSKKGQDIQLTSKGYDILNEIYLNLKEFIETEKSKILIEGTIVKGIGDGAYYVREYSDKINKALKIKPFFGTLNIKPSRKILNLDRSTIGKINEFKKGGRTFSSIKYAPAKLLINHKKEDCYLIVPKRTHHRDEIEIISEFNLKKKFGLKNGDGVRIEIST